MSSIATRQRLGSSVLEKSAAKIVSRVRLETCGVKYVSASIVLRNVRLFQPSLHNDKPIAVRHYAIILETKASCFLSQSRQLRQLDAAGYGRIN